MIPNNETERMLNATEEEMDAMQYITASKIIHLKNKYKDPELRILWERSYARRMIQRMQDKLNIYEHGYRFAVPITVCLGILAAFTGWICDFNITIHATYAFALSSFLLFNLYLFGKTILLFKTGDAYKEDKEREFKETLFEYYKPVQKEQEGEWIPIKEAADTLIVSMKTLGKIIKENVFIKKRDSKNTYFLAKKLNKK